LCRPARVLETPRDGTLVASPVFLLHLLQNFYEELNIRSVRRKLADLYSANLLTMSRDLPSADTLLWGMSAIPHTHGIKLLIFNFFKNFINARVQAMVDAQLLFNGQGVRFDGNFDMARQVAVKIASWFWTGVNTYCGCVFVKICFSFDIGIVLA
jgi:hypothetical protein